MTEARPVTIRRLGADDLVAYKLLRDEMLAAHPDAFTSDADEEARKPADTYRARFGLDGPFDGTFTLGAFAGGLLAGALSCERMPRRKERHIGHIAGMMVRPAHRGTGLARRLLDEAMALARETQGLRMLTLSVTDTNERAVLLYTAAGFVPYGRLERAIHDGGRYHDKLYMLLRL